MKFFKNFPKEKKRPRYSYPMNKEDVAENNAKLIESMGLWCPDRATSKLRCVSREMTICINL